MLDSNTCSPYGHASKGGNGPVGASFPRRRSARVRAVQQSLDELGTPLVEVEFAVLDLETTGGSPATDRITEVGVVKVRGGEVTGTFHALVNPLMPIPPMITALTGISDAMVANQEPIEVVLPCLLEFLGDAVLVAHNASFDTRFLQAALQAHAYPRLESSIVCTARLAGCSCLATKYRTSSSPPSPATYAPAPSRATAPLPTPRPPWTSCTPFLSARPASVCLL